MAEKTNKQRLIIIKIHSLSSDEFAVDAVFDRHQFLVRALFD